MLKSVSRGLVLCLLTGAVGLSAQSAPPTATALSGTPVNCAALAGLTFEGAARHCQCSTGLPAHPPTHALGQR